MQYEAPELIVLPSLDCIQNSLLQKTKKGMLDYLSASNDKNEPQLGYADWE